MLISDPLIPLVRRLLLCFSLRPRGDGAAQLVNPDDIQWRKVLKGTCISHQVLKNMMNEDTYLMGTFESRVQGA